MAEIINKIPNKSIDTVFLLDVIEHLKKDESIALLKETEKVVKQQIIIFTPLGFAAQPSYNGKDAWGLDGEQYQEHKSGWSPDDFDNAWTIFASKKFHSMDGWGRPLKIPHGAFWAIKNLNTNAVLQSKKKRIKNFVERIIDKI